MYLACLACQKFFHDWPELRAHHFEQAWSVEGTPNDNYRQHLHLVETIYNDEKEDNRGYPYTDFDYGDDRLEAMITRVRA